MRRGLVASLLVIAPMVATATLASETTTYTYDALGRLVSSSNTGGPRNGDAVLSSYDDAGNRRTHAVGVATPTIPNATVFSVTGPASPMDEGATATFTISRSGTASQNMTVNFATVAGGASAPTDYTAQSGTLTFRTWETLKTVTVATITDQVAEPSEQFGLTLSAPSSGSSISTATAMATINPSSAPPPNDPPNAVNDTSTVGVCLNVVKNVVANDTDPDNDLPLRVTAVTSSSAGEVLIDPDQNSISFTAFGTAGNTQVTYTVTDSRGATDTGILAITITSGQGCN